MSTRTNPFRKAPLVEFRRWVGPTGIHLSCRRTKPMRRSDACTNTRISYLTHVASFPRTPGEVRTDQIITGITCFVVITLFALTVWVSVP